MPQPTTPPSPAGRPGTRRASIPLGRRAAISTTYDASVRTVELVAATETPVRIPGWQIGLACDWYWEILDCSEGAVDLSAVAAGNCPLLDAHAAYSMATRLGAITSARIENNQLLTVAAFGESDQARAVEADVASETAPPPPVSAGYRRIEIMYVGEIDDVPVFRVTRWALAEVSFVPIAADPTAGVRSADTVFPCLIMENRAMPPETTTTGEGTPVTTTTTTVIEPASDGQRSGGGHLAVARFTAGTALAFVEQARAFGDTIATRAQELITQNEAGTITIEGARAALMTAAADAQRASTGGVSTGGRAITVTEDERDKFRIGAQNSIIQRAGLTEIFQRAATIRGVTVDLDPGELRGIRNAELARMSLDRAGQRVDSFDRDHVVGQALAFRAGPMNAVGDFPVILEAVVNRTLQAAYAVQPDTWRQFCGVGSVSDFKPTSSLLRGTFGRLDRVTENGQVKTKDIPDGAKEMIQARPNGNIIGLTRQAIVNDDLGAFNDLAVEIGRAGKLSIEADVYDLLALNGGLGPVMNDTKTLFHADHGNLVAAGGALSIAQMEQMDLLFANQKDLSGNEFLDLQLSVLVVPRAQRGDALVINNSEFDTDTAGKFMKPNKVRGLFETIVGTPRLAGTRRYGFADPAVAPTIKVVFLNGEQEPRVETKDGWRIDGTEWRVLFDYGVGAVNWRSGVTDPGQ